ncbi:aminopeptidase, partial [Erysipelothrix rhusiopathiae]|nr:aminopeptidase [Erysipelothrix rhusiopathiae]
VEESYAAGAKKVVIKFGDDHIAKMHVQNQDIETLTDIPQWLIVFINKPLWNIGKCFNILILNMHFRNMIITKFDNNFFSTCCIR